MTHPDQTITSQSGRDVRNGLFYLLAGAGIGATLALLFAPKSGADLRHDITDITRKGYDGTRELAGNLKNHSSEIFHTLVDKKDQVLDLAASRFSRASGAADAAVTAVEEQAASTLGELEETTVPKNTGTGRRSSSIV